ncbi:peptide chain release factor N(5)-glutamine methyltransferase [Chryseomicrobium palamuruense]|uniref:Release factor glutamine methyltransferase n=1 Tax=Chryseomicrobium palamuruense TaxID=682973 RepID=A0ABV8UTQ1_9BACL
MKAHFNSYQEALAWASSYLQTRGREELAARFFLQDISELNYTDLMMCLQDEMPEVIQTRFIEGIEAIGEGMPYQYIVGKAEFYGRHFFVTPATLIPRPETEELIEQVVARKKALFGQAPVNLADVGTGTGCIAVTLKLEMHEADVVAVDISGEALEVATKNAVNLGADVTFLQGDLTAPIEARSLDVFVSNPPYIAESEKVDMTDTVLAHEPHLALFAEDEGLYFYKRIIQRLPVVMKEKGLIAFEIGYLQGPAVARLLQDAFPEAVVDVVADLNGRDRMVFATL